MNVDAFKSAFGAAGNAAAWAEQARTQAATALDGLRRLLSGWEGEVAASFAEAAEVFLAELSALPAEPAAALAACAMLRDDVDVLTAEARAARQAEQPGAQQQWLAAAARLGARIEALDASVVAPEIAALSATLGEARRLAEACAFPTAEAACAEIDAGCEAAEEIARASERARKEQWQCVAMNMLALRALGVPDALAADMGDLQLRAVRIQGLISERQFDLAIELCVHFVLEAERVTALAGRHQRWARAHQILAAQGAHPLLQESEQAALWRDFDRAMRLLEGAHIAIDAARRADAQRAEIEAVLASVPQATAALPAARSRLEALEAQVRDALGGDLSRALERAERLRDGVREVLDAPDDRGGALQRAVDAERPALAALREIPVDEQIVAALHQKLDAAAASADPEEGFVALDAVAEGIADAARAAQAKRACMALLDEADMSLASLEFYDHTPASEARLEALLARLEEGRDLMEAGAVAEASQKLSGIAPDAEAEMVALDLRAGDPADASMSVLLERPGGPARLDAIVEDAGSSMSDAALEEAIEARFGVALRVEADPSAGDAAPSLERIYALLSAVPEAHVRDNPHLAEVIFHAEADDMSSYLEGGGQISLRCGRAEAARSVVLLDADGAAVLDADHRPPEGAAATHFDWSTLHEVGHAVEHKLGFMKQHAGEAAFGGWTEHGADVAAIARQAASRFAFDEDYIAQRLCDRPAPTPPVPPEVDDAAWRTRLAAVERWCALVRGPLWGSHAQSADAAIDGVVFHEAYPKRWVSYPLDARTKATSGYQFRSPIEWFAELYAAYHAGLLSSSHSARAWLEVL